MSSTKTLARVAGVLYLIVAVGGAFAESVRTSALVSGDATTTAANVVQRATLFHVAFVADLVDFTCFLGVGLLLFAILRSVDVRVATAMLAINAVSVAIQALNMLNHVGALLVATNPSFTEGLSSEASHSLVLLFLELHRQGCLIAQIFFGGYLLPLGYLIYRSGMFPRALGVIVMLGAGGYLAGVAATYVTSAFDSSLAVYFGIAGGIGELVFLLWLLAVGVKASGASPIKGAQLA
ncbi:MAG TPA: DUF4386 domain-containing protein [Candidatus Dormibacteraeota bacterium]|nr:DUF4386 domain-containing protein [Candidatus Dormibacteraeota bacterium]